MPHSARANGALDSELAPGIERLTASQLEVLQLIAMGYSNAEIARRRSQTVSGVEQLVTAMFRSLGLRGKTEVNPRVEAVRMYVQLAGVPERVEAQ